MMPQSLLDYVHPKNLQVFIFTTSVIPQPNFRMTRCLRFFCRKHFLENPSQVDMTTMTYPTQLLGPMAMPRLLFALVVVVAVLLSSTDAFRSNFRAVIASPRSTTRSYMFGFGKKPEPKPPAPEVKEDEGKKKLPDKTMVVRSVLWATTPWIFNSFEVPAVIVDAHHPFLFSNALPPTSSLIIVPLLTIIILYRTPRTTLMAKRLSK